MIRPELLSGPCIIMGGYSEHDVLNIEPLTIHTTTGWLVLFGGQINYMLYFAVSNHTHVLVP